MQTLFFRLNLAPTKLSIDKANPLPLLVLQASAKMLMMAFT